MRYNNSKGLLAVAMRKQDQLDRTEDSVGVDDIYNSKPRIDEVEVEGTPADVQVRFRCTTVCGFTLPTHRWAGN